MTKPSNAIKRTQKKRASIRANIFPSIDNSRIWDVKDRAKTKGYASMPRTMPLIGAIADLMAGKGKPVSNTYLELWCRADEQGFLIINKLRDISFASGFSGERGVTTWKQRMKKLQELNFITAKEGPSGDFHYVQIWNPYLVLKDHRQNKTENFSEKHFNALVERHEEIGAIDLNSSE